MTDKRTFHGLRFQRYTSDTPRQGSVELDIDLDRLVKKLGMRAAYNKNHRSRLAIGIKAKFIPEKGSKS